MHWRDLCSKLFLKHCFKIVSETSDNFTCSNPICSKMSRFRNSRVDSHSSFWLNALPTSLASGHGWMKRQEAPSKDGLDSRQARLAGWSEWIECVRSRSRTKNVSDRTTKKKHDQCIYDVAREIVWWSCCENMNLEHKATTTTASLLPKVRTKVKIDYIFILLRAKQNLTQYYFERAFL